MIEIGAIFKVGKKSNIQKNIKNLFDFLNTCYRESDLLQDYPSHTDDMTELYNTS